MPDGTRCSETDELHVRTSCAIYPTLEWARPELPDHVPGKMTLIRRVIADDHMDALQDAQCGYKGPPFPSFESEHKLLPLAMGMKGSHELGVDLKVLLQLAMGMKALHERGIYHRDLKADNVLVTRHSHPDSKPCPISELHITDCERSEDVLGTGFYRAPEVKSFILNDDEPARKRFRTLDWVAENLPEKYCLDRASNSFSSEDEGLSGDSMATVESQAEDTADSQVPRTNQSHQLGSETNSNFADKKRSAATVYEDDLMSSIALLVNKQIEEALKPLLSVLQSREEEQKHREKLLAIEEEKLALKREKMLYTQCMLANSNCFQF